MLMLPAQAVGEKFLDVYFSKDMLSYIKKGPVLVGSQLVKMAQSTLQICAEEIPEVCRPFIKPSMDLLSRVSRCLVYLCRATPGVLNSTVDDLLYILSDEADAHVWKEKVKSILEDPSGEWTVLLADAVRTAATTKEVMPTFNAALAAVQDSSTDFDALAGYVKQLPRLKESMRPGAVKKLSKLYHERLMQAAQAVLSTEEGQEGENIGGARLRDLITFLGLLDESEGTENTIEELRKFSASRQSSLALADLRQFASLVVTEQKMEGKWKDFASIMDSVNAKAEVKDSDLDQFPKLLEIVLLGMKHEAQVPGCC